CGTRGSTPVSGAGQARYGGNTSCVGLAHDGQPPTIVLDAGTGLQQLPRALGGEPFRGTILLGHLHWDHTHGMPFFRSGLQPGHRVDLYLPEQGEDAEELLARVISPPHFPIRPRQLGEGWTFNSLSPGHYEFEGFSVDAREIPHKGGRTFGYRVSDGTGTVAYMSDHSPISLGPGPDGLGEYHEAAVELARGADLLVHDSQHTAAELPRLAFLGHSAIEYVVGLAQHAQVKAVALYHHDPWRTDDEIDELAAKQASAPLAVFAAYDGLIVDLP
ncbi:MAG: MBL fold metallo-hydrolase, partial [Streptosporangiaceae bacterium]